MYSFEQKKDLKKKIEKIKDIEHLKNIKYIIDKDNPNKEWIVSTNSIMIFFHDLNEITYKNVNKYLLYLKKNELSTLEKSIESINSI